MDGCVNFIIIKSLLNMGKKDNTKGFNSFVSSLFTNKKSKNEGDKN